LRSLDEYNSSLADIDQGRYDRALEKLARVLAQIPDNAETNFALGNAWLGKGDVQKAKGYYRRTLELDPQHYRALNNLGVIAFQENNWPVAELLLAGSLAIEPGDAKTNYLLACTRLQRHERAGAEAAIAEAVRLRPDREDFRKLRDELASASGTVTLPQLSAASLAPATAVPPVP
jgi:Flp pilus assembly protein TadD